MRVLVLALLTLLASALPAAAATAPCTQETLTVEGSPLEIGYCVSATPRSSGQDEVIVPVSARYSAPRGSLARSLEFHFVAGEGVSRVLESLDLTQVGLTGVLHLTLAYSRGLVRVEGALLTPGAITIK